MSPLGTRGEGTVPGAGLRPAVTAPPPPPRSPEGPPLPGLAPLLVALAACAPLWPPLVRESPQAPLFRSGGLLVGPLRTDGAMCSLATVGPESTLLVTPPRPPASPLALEAACGAGTRPAAGEAIEMPTGEGLAVGHLWLPAGATGLVVVFSGLGMPPDGWVNARLAAHAARRGLATFAPVRDESPRPIVLDPLREARKAVLAADQLLRSCGLGGAPAFLGISLGGLEALLAGREAGRGGAETRAAVLDPVLDLAAATAHLDSFWHPFADDGMQAYFRRILRGRFGEEEATGFQDVLRRMERAPGLRTRPREDSPSAWLCAAPRGSFAVFLSDSDPVLGDEQRAFGLGCGYPFRPAGAPGHTPFACRLELFEELLDAVAPGPAGPSPAP